MASLKRPAVFHGIAPNKLLPDRLDLEKPDGLTIIGDSDVETGSGPPIRKLTDRQDRGVPPEMGVRPRPAGRAFWRHSSAVSAILRPLTPRGLRGMDENPLVTTGAEVLRGR